MEIKGDRRGLRLLARGFTEEDLLIADLKRTLTEREDFLGQSALLLEVDGLPTSTSLFQRVFEVFAQFPSLTLRGIEHTDQSQGILSMEPRATLPSAPKIVRQTLRSGQRITHQGDIVIIGDVNPGATVVATGDVMVFGWLRGSVSAGQPADLARTISALRFQPTQIRIGDRMALGDTQYGNTPEIARVDGDTLVAETWEDIRLPEAVTREPRDWKDRLAHLANPS